MKRFVLALFLVVICRADQSSPVPKLSVADKPGVTTTLATVHDPHSYARPDEVRVEHVTLDLDVNFEKKQLIGSATLRVKRMQPADAMLILDTSGLSIARVTLMPGGAAAVYRLGDVDPLLGRKLEIELLPETTAVAIEYATSPAARALQWLEPPMTAGKKFPCLLSQSEAILARTWVPLQDTPHVRFTYDATLRVPRELLALMSAENPQEKSPDGVYHFRMRQPVPSYLLAIAVGDVAFRPFDGRSGVYAEPSVLDAAAREFDELPRMILAAEELYGAYQWGRYDVLVLPPSFPYGGMENPRLTFVSPTAIAGDKSLVDLVAHELAHSWSGNLVTNATWNDFWLNEGFTTYFQHRIMERLHGREFSEMLWSLEFTRARADLAALPTRDQLLYLELEGRDPDDAPDTVYGKGALLLRLLEETVGRERWDRFLRSYFGTHGFQTMTTVAFIAELNAALPDVARQVDIQAWIYGPGLPANCPVPQSIALDKVTEAANRWVATGEITGIDPLRWSFLERVHFIELLPRLTPERMGELDAHFHFSESGNSEILLVWLRKAAQERYRGAYPAIERFLTTQGRRRLIKTVYEMLAQNPEDLAFARRIYAQARPAYHPLSQSAIDAILK